MPRKKVPPERQLKTEGIGLNAKMLAKLEVWATRWDTTRSDAGRELLLLGLSMVETFEQQGMHMPFLNLTETYRKPVLQSPQTPISTMTKTDLTTDDHAAHTRKSDAERTHEEPHVGEGDGKPPNEMPPSDPPRRRPSDFRLVGTAYPETEQAKVEGTPLKIRK